MDFPRQKVINACKAILGREKYESLITLRFPLPRIADMCVRKAFLEKIDNEDLRKAIIILDNDGHWIY